MDITTPQALLGGLSPEQFMRTHWQKKPLLVRQAIAGFKPLLSRAELFDLAASEDVESRLLRQDGGDWQLSHGPLSRRSLPTLKTPHWTVLVQGVDLHLDAAHDLLRRFRFVPDARLDDLMISWASDGGGVGPHFDSYDVFLLQAQGRRRWRIGRQQDLTLVPDLPLKILQHFEPEEEYVLEPGDMLYLPPRWAHDGVAEGECMTYSIGFRQPNRGELARELLQRLADEAADLVGDQAYTDPDQPATATPGQLPQAMLDFAADALARVVAERHMLALLLGEWMTEPKPQVWFEGGERGHDGPLGALVLDRRTRMMHDAGHLYINGESYEIGGQDARLMRQLADTRELDAAQARQISAEARPWVIDWLQAGWLHERP